MVMKSVVTDIEEIDEAQRVEYKEREVTDPKTKAKSKVWALDIEGHDNHPDMRKVKSEAAEHRIAARTANEIVKKFEPLKDLDVNDVLDKVARFPELEALAAGKVDDKQIESMVETRIKTKLTPLQRELDTVKGKNVELEKTNGELTAAQKRRVITDQVRSTATKLKLRTAAVEDAEIYAHRDFTVEEDGSVVTKEGADVEAWLTEMVEKRPHWLADSESANSRGGGKGDGFTGKNPWTHENWNMTEQSQIYKADKVKAEKMAKSAGTIIGGRKPDPKK